MKKNKIILVTGGARSGKSSFAEKLAREAGQKRCYLATCPVLDDEMRCRVAHHRELRAGDDWETIEEEVDLCGALRRAEAGGAESILVDCLTLWVNNLLYRDATLDESAMSSIAGDLIGTLRKMDCTVVLVLNEVGLGLVPESALGRRFRDMSGRCGQMIAAVADEVYFMVAGLSMKIK